MALGDKKTPAGKRAAETFSRLEGLRKDATRPVSFRLKPQEYNRLVKMAETQGLKVSQLVKSWVIQQLQ